MFQLIILSLNESCTSENWKRNPSSPHLLLNPCSYCICTEISTQCYLNFNDAPCQPVVTTERNPDVRWIVVTVPHSAMRTVFTLTAFLERNGKAVGKKGQDWFLSEKYELTVSFTLLVSHKLFFLFF